MRRFMQGPVRSVTHSASAHRSFQTPEAETPSPEPRDEEPDAPQRPAGEQRLETRMESSKQLSSDDNTAKNNNNNMLASQTFALVTSDT
ncbi:hypothetical protein EYF80_054411 [Liparis tanakae]|uniref:Uncharacterized protein n=1 Tax=Liparis tanakae TaxID=230148 RepID=A0A4Z2F2Z1_9TELE|nr:hypothetical protein EYF80_054411 [Liparis tanakae]